jgi:hypothetical protein
MRSGKATRELVANTRISLKEAWVEGLPGQLIEHMKAAALGSPMDEGRGPLSCNLQEVWLLKSSRGCHQQFDTAEIATTQLIERGERMRCSNR